MYKRDVQRSSARLRSAPPQSRASRRIRNHKVPRCTLLAFGGGRLGLGLLKLIDGGDASHESHAERREDEGTNLSERTNVRAFLESSSPKMLRSTITREFSPREQAEER